MTSDLHCNIALDWRLLKTANGSKWCPPIEQDEDRDSIGTINDECHICGWKLVGRTMLLHVDQYVPFGKVDSRSFSCTKCSILFREHQAKLQHVKFESIETNIVGVVFHNKSDQLNVFHIH
jgi:hypothetical protein